MIRPARTLAAFALAAATACSGVTFRPDVAAWVDEVERARLRAHVFALDAIGPRPVSDVAATRAPVDYIAARLRDLGYDVHEEHFDLELASRVIAIVRPVDEPDAEPTELELAPDLVPAGRQAMNVVGEWSSGWLGNLFEGAIDAYAPELPYYSANRLGSSFRDGDRSDHANYWRAGLPAIMVTGTGEFRRSTYHGPGDTADTIDYAFLESVTRATAAAALHWAELEPPSQSSANP